MPIKEVLPVIGPSLELSPDAHILVVGPIEAHVRKGQHAGSDESGKGSRTKEEKRAATDQREWWQQMLRGGDDDPPTSRVPTCQA